MKRDVWLVCVERDREPELIVGIFADLEEAEEWVLHERLRPFSRDIYKIEKGYLIYD